MLIESDVACIALQDSMRVINWPVKGIFDLNADGKRAKEAAQDSTRYQLLLPLPRAPAASSKGAPASSKAAAGSDARPQRTSSRPRGKP